MKALCVLLLIASFSVLGEGAIVVIPQVDNSLRFVTEGVTDGSGANTITVAQAEGKKVIVQLIPSAPGRCEGGNIAIGTLRLSVKNFIDNSILRCGEPLLFNEPSHDSRLQFYIERDAAVQSSVSANALTSTRRYGSMIRIASLVVSGDENQPTSTTIFLDQSQLIRELVTLSASFDKATLEFGLVGDIRDVSASAVLRIAKTLQAGNEVIPYDLSFESSQQQSNRYRMRTSKGEKFIPYQIYVNSNPVSPGSPYRGQVPAGSATADVLTVEFRLPQKATQGVDAQTQLLDTVTAIITPES